MTHLSCSDVAGTTVPASLSDVSCNAESAASTALEYSCKGGGKYFWLSAEKPDGTDIAPYVGKPGGKWVAGSTDANITQLARLIGC